MILDTVILNKIAKLNSENNETLDAANLSKFNFIQKEHLAEHNIPILNSSININDSQHTLLHDVKTKVVAPTLAKDLLTTTTPNKLYVNTSLSDSLATIMPSSGYLNTNHVTSSNLSSAASCSNYLPTSSSKSKKITIPSTTDLSNIQSTLEQHKQEQQRHQQHQQQQLVAAAAAASLISNYQVIFL